ncbi:VWA domain-containing protein [Actinomadura chibensis]|uniref:VWA domain-containing protein n=1 Tax=Actinomadura chibensis TaxID=392828 RepID=A0A5D0NLX5_9ACTN|nr:vWA domain-containing protein [Actinomadura chibensis]TYB45496.1 VWA domain-containing protein [Actinomadura chibensis]
MDAQPSFDLQVSQIKFLSREESEMHAIVTVGARNAGAGPGGRAPEGAEIVLVDCSTSMGDPPSKMVAARRATIAAIDSMRDGTRFAVVAGTHEARMAYPREEATAVADPRSRADAATAVHRLYANGGTAMGTWLARARVLLDGHPAAIRHAVLLTDGFNVSEARAELDRELAACAGHFSCDARGIGDGWEPEELLRIVTALGGTADAVRREDELEADFRALMRTAMGKAVPAVALRVSTPPDVRTRFVKQVFPAFADLAGKTREVDARTVEVDTGAWGDEVREFHVCLALDSADRELSVDRRVARLDLLPEGDATVDGSPANVFVHWTDDPRLSTLIDPKMSRYTRHGELKEAIDTGFEAYRSGDPKRAAAEWARAMELAAKLENDRILRRLRRVVAVDSDGLPRLRDDAGDLDSKRLRIASRDTHGGADGRGAAPGSARGEPEGATRTCPNCDRRTPSGTYCTHCGAPMNGGASGGAV